MCRANCWKHVFCILFFSFPKKSFYLKFIWALCFINTLCGVIWYVCQCLRRLSNQCVIMIVFARKKVLRQPKWLVRSDVWFSEETPLLFCFCLTSKITIFHLLSVNMFCFLFRSMWGWYVCTCACVRVCVLERRVSSNVRYFSSFQILIPLLSVLCFN